ncbi:tyrosine-type recombinase/integrase [Natronorarus salvus]|uniref:tyrosine-type recombinase/integrase n=1 Tax=Natronorarus salvus TaxID=3117733 RepID=UPI002F25FC4C
MPSDPAKEIRSLREALEAGERGGDKRDRELLLAASNEMRLVPSEIGDHRHIKILRHNTIMSEQAGSLADALKDRDPAKELVRWIHREKTNEHTNQDYRTTLRTFGRFALGLEEPPESLSWIPTSTSNDFDPTPSERDLLTYEGDVKPMIDACQNPRDRALIVTQFEAGLRGGELYDLRAGDVFDGEHTAGLHVDGKRGERSVHLKISLPYLRRWLSEHPAGDDVNAPMWSKLDVPELPSEPTFYNYFRRAAERAGVTKEVTPTNFRKSNTRWLVIQGLAAPRIEDRQGRKRGSEHTARYLARFGSESNERAFLAALGEDIDVDEDEEAETPLTCPRCDRDTPRDRPFCMWCRFAIAPEATEALEATREATVNEMVDAESRDARVLFAQFLEFLDEEPHRVPSGVHDRLTSSSSSNE